MVAFALLAVLAGADLSGVEWLKARTISRPRLILAAFGVVSATLLAMDWFKVKGAPPQGLEARIEQLAPRPRLMTISGDIALGHPLIRELHGTWVERVCSQWASYGVISRERRDPAMSPAERALLDEIVAIDRAHLVEDITSGRPQVILIDHRRYDWATWARADARLAAALSSYRYDSSIDGVDIYVRR
jgi:hypothetical protein